MFIGLWPPPDVRARIEGQAAGWSWPPQARRTPAERLHITLHFIGNVPVARVAELQSVLDLRWQGCCLRLDRSAVWPGGIAVLEASQVPPPMAELHARLGAALAGCGIEPEGRRYRPHVTLARHAKGARAPGVPVPIDWETGRSCLLLRSLPGGRGYQPVQVLG